MAHLYDLTGTMHNMDDIDLGMSQGLIASTTTILGDVFAKPHLLPWMVRESLKSLVSDTKNKWSSEEYLNLVLEAMPEYTDQRAVVAHTLSVVCNEFDAASIKAAEYRNTEGSDFGTVGHGLIARHMGGPIEAGVLENMTDDHIICIKPATDWVDRNVKKVIWIEKSFCWPQKKYAGTMDALAEMNDGMYCLFDFKFKKDSYKYPMHPEPEYALQLAAYKDYASHALDIPADKIRTGNLLVASKTVSNKYFSKPRAAFIEYDYDYRPHFNAVKEMFYFMHRKRKIVAENKSYR